MPGFDGAQSFLVHYLDGRLTKAAVPVGPRRIDVVSVAHIPGTAQLLGGGFTHAVNNPAVGVVSVILQYEG
jgi:hypothetical protein